jgi:hypothetical protein
MKQFVTTYKCVKDFRDRTKGETLTRVDNEDEIDSRFKGDDKPRLIYEWVILQNLKHFKPIE